VSEVIFGRHAKYPQDGGSVHPKPRSTSEFREGRIVNSGDIKRHSGKLTVSDGHCGGNADVPLFVEHCEAVTAEIDVKLRWLGEQARRGLSVWSGALPVRHVMLEVVCEPSVVGSL
jgi:hypothetical protein